MHKQLKYRPNLTPTSTVHSMVAKGICWHFDAWLFRDTDNSLYLDVQTRRGGRDLIARNVYRAIHGNTRLATVARVPETAQALTLHDRAELPWYAELNALHWRYVVPMIARRPDAFRSQSVALHYLRAPSLDPFGGAGENFHVYERRMA